MIRQAELLEVLELAGTVAAMERRPAVRSYLAAEHLLSERLAGLRKRVREDEPVQSGRLRLAVKRSLVVSYEKLVALLRCLPPVERVLQHVVEARDLIRQAADRDPCAAFVSERLTVEVVEA